MLWREFSLEDELEVSSGAVDSGPGGEDLNQAPAFASALVDRLLILVARIAPGTHETFTEADELVFVSGVVGRNHKAMVDQLWRDRDYKCPRCLEQWGGVSLRTATGAEGGGQEIAVRGGTEQKAD